MGQDGDSPATERMTHDRVAGTAPRDEHLTIGRFKVRRELGRGGMGIVYEVEDPELGRRVAVKVFRDQPTRSGQRRLLGEARTLARLAHPNVVPVFEVGTDEEYVYIVMEL